jgi:sec-independent protein translocase protein TatA
MGKTEVILLIVAVIIVLFVGGKKLPELARGIGQAGKEIRKGFNDDTDDSKKSDESDKEKNKKE